MKYRVIDDRNNETLFESNRRSECADFMDKIYEKNPTDWLYAWLEEVE